MGIPAGTAGFSGEKSNLPSGIGSAAASISSFSTILISRSMADAFAAFAYHPFCGYAGVKIPERLARKRLWYSR
jgi:hypothetical protein